jgi:hypothetical protein
VPLAEKLDRVRVAADHEGVRLLSRLAWSLALTLVACGGGGAGTGQASKATSGRDAGHLPDGAARGHADARDGSRRDRIDATIEDAWRGDATKPDGGGIDATRLDGGGVDVARNDAGRIDATTLDGGGVDVARNDARRIDATTLDASRRDVWSPDAPARDVVHAPDGPACPTGSALGPVDASFDATPPPVDDRLLFIGNSFTFTNDLPGTFRSMVAAWAPSSGAPYVESFAQGGATLSGDVASISSDGADAGLGLLLGVADGGHARWTNVMLQEQSEIPGFGLYNAERMASMTAVVQLSGDAVATGATPVLMMTWGYRTGDPYNASIYPDFPTMEWLLEQGYQQMADAVAEAGYPVRLAPIGPAFQAVYSLDVAAGRSPTASTSVFYSLYEADGKHPAPPGTYLMSLVLMSTLYGVDPAAVCANPKGLAPDVMQDLQEAARTAIVAARAYPDAGFDGAF